MFYICLFNIIVKDYLISTAWGNCDSSLEIKHYEKSIRLIEEILKEGQIMKQTSHVSPVTAAHLPHISVNLQLEAAGGASY